MVFLFVDVGVGTTFLLHEWRLLLACYDHRHSRVPVVSIGDCSGRLEQLF